MEEVRFVVVVVVNLSPCGPVSLCWAYRRAENEDVQNMSCFLSSRNFENGQICYSNLAAAAQMQNLATAAMHIMKT